MGFVSILWDFIPYPFNEYIFPSWYSSRRIVLFSCAIKTVGFTEVSLCVEEESYILILSEKGLLFICIKLQGGLFPL